MPGSVAVIAALPREIKGLVKPSKPDGALIKRSVYLYRVPGGVVVAAGMGSARASLAFQTALQSVQVTQVISVGLAGACAAGIQPGSVIEATRVIDVRTGERFSTAAESEPITLASTDVIASISEKARLQASYRASLVDMEAATVARLARAHDLPFRAIKGISDAYDFELASLSRFADGQGQFRTAAFALHTALHPAEWRGAITLGRNSTQALEQLTARIQQVLAKTA